MKSHPWSFELTYWGTTGSFPRTQSPDDFYTRTAEAIWQLHAKGQLHDILDGATNTQQLATRVAQRLQHVNNIAFGGNTTCVELRTNEVDILIDAGSGLEAWSQCRQHNRLGRDKHLFLTHAHLDHTCALAYADAMFDPVCQFTIWAAPNVVDRLRYVLGTDLETPSGLVPVNWRQLRGIRELRPLPSSSDVQLADVTVSTLPLQHPGGALGFRFQRADKRFVVVTDHEQTTVPDPSVVEFAMNADILYLDAQFTQQEYDGQRSLGSSPATCRRGWGHSTVEAGIVTALSAKVRQLHLGHHDPRRSDEELASIELFAKSYAAQHCQADHILNVCLAREGDTYQL